MAKEIIKEAKRMGLSIKDLILKAECIEEYGGTMHPTFSGYSADNLREAAGMMTIGLPSL